MATYRWLDAPPASITRMKSRAAEQRILMRRSDMRAPSLSAAASASAAYASAMRAKGSAERAAAAAAPASSNPSYLSDMAAAETASKQASLATSMALAAACESNLRAVAAPRLSFSNPAQQRNRPRSPFEFLRQFVRRVLGALQAFEGRQ